MQKDVFVEELTNLSPAITDLKGLGLEDSFISQYRGHYCCLQKKETEKIYSTDELLILLQDYNCSKVQIGMISFLSNVIE